MPKRSITLEIHPEELGVVMTALVDKEESLRLSANKLQESVNRGYWTNLSSKEAAENIILRKRKNALIAHSLQLRLIHKEA